LQNAGFGTLLMDLLTVKEEVFDQQTAALRFDIDLLARRLMGATRWLADRSIADRETPHRLFWRKHRGRSGACGRGGGA
jgi:hypothetical protein